VKHAAAPLLIALALASCGKGKEQNVPLPASRHPVSRRCSN